MARNNIEIDVKTKCIEAGKTQAMVVKEIDTTKVYVNRGDKETGLGRQQDLYKNDGSSWVRYRVALCEEEQLIFVVNIFDRNQ